MRKPTNAELQSRVADLQANEVPLFSAKHVLAVVIENGAEILHDAADFYTEVEIDEHSRFIAYGFLHNFRTDTVIAEIGCGAGESVLNVYTGDAWLLAEQWQTWQPLACRIIAERLKGWHSGKA